MNFINLFRRFTGLDFFIHYTGHLHEGLSLRLLYRATNAIVIPSWQYILPNTSVEANWHVEQLS